MMRPLTRDEWFRLLMRTRKKAPPLPPTDEGPYKRPDESETDEPPTLAPPDANR